LRLRVLAVSFNDLTSLLHGDLPKLSYTQDEDLENQVRRIAYRNAKGMDVIAEFDRATRTNDSNLDPYESLLITRKLAHCQTTMEIIVDRLDQLERQKIAYIHQ